MKSAAPVKQISQLLSTLGQPVRLQILLSIGEGEACVCHLEAVLGRRQAYISQHLMALRQAGILHSRREGKYVYYRLADPDYLDLLQAGTNLVGGEQRVELPVLNATQCQCPHCDPE